MRKASIVVGSIAAATAGSAIFGGVAVASHGCDDGCHSSHHRQGNDNARGGDGQGGDATNNCLNVGVPILSGIGVGGSGDARGATCNASANGRGGSAY